MTATIDTVPAYAGAGLLASSTGAAVGSWLSGKSARELDDLARRREQEQARAGVRAAAAFIRADLVAGRRRLRDAMEDNEWHVFYRLPTSAWREHGPTIATSLRPDDVGEIAFSFVRLEDFERAISALPALRSGIVIEGAPRPIPFNSDMREKVKEIVGLAGTALGLLEALAPRDRELPPLKPGQRRVWPPAPRPPI